MINKMPEKQTIFISWSGQSGKIIAQAVSRAIKLMIPSADVFMAKVDINKGKDWRETLENRLLDAVFGLFIITPSMGNPEWLAFEAGAITQAASNNTKIQIFPLIFDGIDGNSRVPADVPKYIEDKQFTRFEEDEWKTLFDLFYIDSDSRDSRKKERDHDLFKLVWKDLKSEISKIQKELVLESLRMESEDGTSNTPRKGKDYLMREVDSIKTLSQEIVPAIEGKLDYIHKDLKEESLERMSRIIEYIEKFQDSLIEPLQSSGVVDKNTDEQKPNFSPDLDPNLSHLRRVVKRIEELGLLESEALNELKKAIQNLI